MVKFQKSTKSLSKLNTRVLLSLCARRHAIHQRVNQNGRLAKRAKRIKDATNLKEALALEVDELLLAGAQQEADELVVYVDVDVEEVAERDAEDLGLVLAGRAVLVDNVAQLEDLLHYVG